MFVKRGCYTIYLGVVSVLKCFNSYNFFGNNFISSSFYLNIDDYVLTYVLYKIFRQFHELKYLCHKRKRKN